MIRARIPTPGPDPIPVGPAYTILACDERRATVPLSHEVARGPPAAVGRHGAPATAVRRRPANGDRRGSLPASEAPGEGAYSALYGVYRAWICSRIDGSVMSSHGHAAS